MAIRAVLFDIGDTLVHSDEADEALRQLHLRALRDNGVRVSEEEYEAALSHCTAAFAPSMTRAINWYFVKPEAELCDRIADEVRASLYAWADDHPLPPRPGTAEVLADLSERVPLALAGNARASAREMLEGTGCCSISVTRTSPTTSATKSPTCASSSTSWRSAV